MIVMIGVLLVLCLAGAWLACQLEEPRSGTPAPDVDEPEQRPWVHVESGPDSFHPIAASRNGSKRNADTER